MRNRIVLAGREGLVQGEGGAHRARRIVEGGHRGVADRLHDGPLVGHHGAKDAREMLAHGGEGLGIAAFEVEPGRAHDVGEEDGLLADGEVDPSRDELLAEQIAEGLERQELRRPQHVVGPSHLLHDEDRLFVAVVVELEATGPLTLVSAGGATADQRIEPPSPLPATSR
ncbi:MAG: hypothetical protein R3B72_15710 [Polyangiaceae bacterium]